MFCEDSDEGLGIIMALVCKVLLLSAYTANVRWLDVVVSSTGNYAVGKERNEFWLIQGL